jgi:hypothetical protein
MACAPCKAALDKAKADGIGPFAGCVKCKQRMANMEASESGVVRGVAKAIRPIHEALTGKDKPRRVLGSK